MKSILIAAVIGVTASIHFSACSGIHVGQQFNAGRNALQTGRPDEAAGFLMAAAEADPQFGFRTASV
jgi:hypothetical protein